MNNRPISGLQKEETEENLWEVKLSQAKLTQVNSSQAKLIQAKSSQLKLRYMSCMFTNRQVKKLCW